MWFPFAFLTAFFESVSDVLGKESLRRELDVSVVAWALRAVAATALVTVFFFRPFPSLDTRFWIALAGSGLINVGTTFFYMEALKSSDLSVAVPMLTFTPVFLLATSPLMVGEFPSGLGLAGVLLIVSGAYVLKIKEKEKGLFAPLRALLQERGSRIMLGIAFAWSLSANIDKIGVRHSSPLFWSFALNAFIAACLTPVMIYRTRFQLKPLAKNAATLLPMGLASGLAVAFQMVALEKALVTYVIAIKRTSTVMSVLWGHLILKEKGFEERFAGTVMMVLGVILIGLSR